MDANSSTMTMLEHIYNSIMAMQWGFQQCLPISWTTLRGKHCRHPIAVMGVVGKFRHGLAVMLSIPRMTTSKTINKIGGKPHKSNPTWNSWYI